MEEKYRLMYAKRVCLLDVLGLGLLALFACVMRNIHKPTTMGDAWTEGFKQMMTDSEAIAVVKVLSIDERELTLDGPMFVHATVLKLLKGRLGRTVDLSIAPAFANYQVGQQRIVLLNQAPLSQRLLSRKVAWGVNTPIGVSLCVSEGALESLSPESLTTFVNGIRNAYVDTCAHEP